MREVLENLSGLAREIFLVDSFSSDRTVEIAHEFGVHVVQRAFEGFGDQWNFALRELPITAPWTMKLDPDERITPALADSIRAALAEDKAEATARGFTLERRLWFMGHAMPVRQRILRIWRTGACQFSDVLVNEHPIVEGEIGHVLGDLEHHDSPNLHHWFDKQNHYTSAEARTVVEGRALAAEPRLFANGLERRMWFKRVYRHVPLRHVLMFLYCYLWLGAWRARRAGLIWSRLRADLYRFIDYKIIEMEWQNRKTADERRSQGD